MTKQPRATAPVVLQLHINRLVVDAAALGDVPRDRLGEQVQSALAARWSEAPSPPMPEWRGLAGHIADAVAPQIERHLPATLWRQAGAPRRNPSS